MRKNLIKSVLAFVGVTLVVATVTVSRLHTAHSQTSGSYIDIGLRVMEAGKSSPTAIAIQNPTAPSGGTCTVDNIAVFGGGVQGSAQCLDNSGKGVASIQVRSTMVTVADMLTLLNAQVCTVATYTKQVVAAEEFNLIFTCSGPASGALSALMIAKNGVLYHIALVDPSDPAATKARMKLADGTVMALRSYP